MSTQDSAVAPAYLNTRDAATYLSLSPRQLEHYRAAGVGPRFARIGRHVRYAVRDLDAWVGERLVERGEGRS